MGPTLAGKKASAQPWPQPPPIPVADQTPLNHLSVRTSTPRAGELPPWQEPAPATAAVPPGQGWASLSRTTTQAAASRRKSSTALPFPRRVAERKPPSMATQTMEPAELVRFRHRPVALPCIGRRSQTTSRSAAYPLWSLEGALHRRIYQPRRTAAWRWGPWSVPPLPQSLAATAASAATKLCRHGA